MERRGFFGAIAAWAVAVWSGGREKSWGGEIRTERVRVSTPASYEPTSAGRVTTTRDGKLRFERWGDINFTETPRFASCGSEIVVPPGWTRVTFRTTVNYDHKYVSWVSTDERDATQEEIEASKRGDYSE